MALEVKYYLRHHRILCYSCTLHFVRRPPPLPRLHLAIASVRNRTRSSSLPPEKPRQGSRRGGTRSSRAASVEGRDLRRAKELEAAAAAAAAERQGTPQSPRAQIAALHRRAGRCILLLSRFVTRSKEEERGAATGIRGRKGAKEASVGLYGAGLAVRGGFCAAAIHPFMSVVLRYGLENDCPACRGGSAPVAFRRRCDAPHEW